MKAFNYAEPRLLRCLHPMIYAIAAIGMPLPQLAHAKETLPPSYMQFQPSAGVIDARISGSFKACIAASDGVTANMQDCIAHEGVRLDKVLNRTYAKVMRRLPHDRARTDLRNRQRDWLTMRWDICLEDMDRAGGGSGGDLVFRDCQLQELVRRTLWLEKQPRSSPAR